MVRQSLALSFLVVSSAVGCGSEVTPAAETVVSDSAGVRIVENIGTQGVVSGWRLSRRPVFRTGWKDDEPTFERIRAGVIRPDGSVVVADSNGQYVYVLSAEGEVIHRMGGRGQGPGEFEGLGAVLAGPGDSIFAQDRNGFSVFEGGELVADRRVPWGWRAGSSRLEFAARTADGAILLVPRAMGAGSGEREWSPAPVVRVSADLDQVDTVVVIDHFEVTPRGDLNPVRYFGSTDIGGGHIVYGRNDRAEIVWYDLEGKMEQIARWDHSIREVNDSDWELYEKAVRSRPGSELNEQGTNRLLAEQKSAFRGTPPVYGVVHADAIGNVWIREYTFAGTMPTEYQILAEDGRWLGSIEVPNGTVPLDITDTHFLGVEQDELDIQAVVLYEIIKPR